MDLHSEEGVTFDFEPVSKTITLEPCLANWLKEEAKRLHVSPSLIIATLLEWARDENILEDDPHMLPGLGRLKTRHQRMVK